MEIKIEFDVSADSRHTVLTISSNLPITMPEYIEQFECWLVDMKLTYAQEIIRRQQLIASGKLIPFIKL